MQTQIHVMPILATEDRNLEYPCIRERPFRRHYLPLEHMLFLPGHVSRRPCTEPPPKRRTRPHQLGRNTLRLLSTEGLPSLHAPNGDQVGSRRETTSLERLQLRGPLLELYAAWDQHGTVTSSRTWLTSNCTTSEGARQTCRATSIRTPTTLNGQPSSTCSGRGSRANVLTCAGSAGDTMAGARRSWPAPARHAKHGMWAADVDLQGSWRGWDARR